jgi:phosphoglycolate phosphatase-like HAD superfamily hydrolase
MTRPVRYSTLVFDCDGVLLHSNRLKTEAFHHVALRFGEEAAEALVDYHVANGGISRYRKFEYLLTHILGRSTQAGEVDALSKAYGECVLDGLLACPVADGLQALREQTPTMGWMIVSGGNQDELRQVFKQRGLDQLFDLGIFGSPAAKDEILLQQFSDTQRRPALFIGDSRYDHRAASAAGLDFIFVHGWSEFAAWQEYCDTHRIAAIEKVAELSTYLQRQ